MSDLTTLESVRRAASRAAQRIFDLAKPGDTPEERARLMATLYAARALHYFAEEIGEAMKSPRERGQQR